MAYSFTVSTPERARLWGTLDLSMFDQASAHLASISPGLFRTTLPPTYPTINVNHYLGFKLKAVPGGAGVSGLREDYAQPLWLLLGAAGLVLVGLVGGIVGVEQHGYNRDNMLLDDAAVHEPKGMPHVGTVWRYAT